MHLHPPGYAYAKQKNVNMPILYEDEIAIKLLRHGKVLLRKTARNLLKTTITNSVETNVTSAIIGEWWVPVIQSQVSDDYLWHNYRWVMSTCDAMSMSLFQSRNLLCLSSLRHCSRLPWLMSSVMINIGSSREQTAYSATTFGWWSFFMISASSRNFNGSIVPTFRVLIATGVRLFHTPEMVK